MLDLSTLNPPQLQAVLHHTGPALVLAGAGSGKTRVITFRMARMIRDGVAPENILGVTFTNKAAQEMRERVGHLVSVRKARQIHLSTFHALGAQILREDIERLGWRAPFTILDENDRFRLLKEVLKEFRLGGTGTNEARILEVISRAKNAMSSPAKLPEARYNPETPRIQRVWERYQMALKNHNAVDFDDLLLLPVRLLTEFPDVQAKYQDRYRYLMVDEYQDTNPIQLKLLQQLVRPPDNNLMVVGDDDQSIYAFRGAVSEYILRFDQFFPGAVTIALEQNYRSTGTILAAANAVIGNNRARHGKRLWSTLGDGSPIEDISFESDIDEADYVARRIAKQAEAQKRPLHDFAILYRAGPLARTFEEALRARRVPYRLVGANSLFDRKDVKDVAAYLWLLLNPRDELSLRRVINWPARHIGTVTLSELVTRANETGAPLWDVVREVAGGDGTGLDARAYQGLRSFVAQIERGQRELLRADAIEMPALVREWLEDTGLNAAIRASEKNPNVLRVRMEILDELLDALERAEGTSARGRLDDFLGRITLDPQSSTSKDETENRVTLMTLHASKGLEFPVVFMVGMCDGILPHSRALQEADGVGEERRLCYVGITRAQQQLVMTRARFAIKRNERVVQKPSRFLAELPTALVRRYKSDRKDASEEQQRTVQLEGIRKVREALDAARGK